MLDANKKMEKTETDDRVKNRHRKGQKTVATSRTSQKPP